MKNLIDFKSLHTRLSTWMLIVGLAFILIACSKTTVYTSFDEYPVYNGDDLELVYTPETSSFRVWSPNATAVKLLLYENGLDGMPYHTEAMKPSKHGTWKLKLKGDLKGKFYTFQVKVDDVWMQETPGIWAKAVGVNGKRAAIIDMQDTDPENWEMDVSPALENFTDIVIYELHMRDFSISPTSGMENKGKYMAFTEAGTVNEFGDKTGIDHLKELGVTHIHLLPVYDYASIDEANLHENKYNWGYDPLNYNTPEGGYSTDPYDPVKRIKEFKQMVQAIHQAGMRVVMDVVYNHTFTGADSHLNLLVPGYFYRFNEDGTWADASACGNETASERAMVRKFIVESVVYWAEEYHIDGFRFDLMGIHDIETMREVRKALDEVDPTIFIYGEGWTAADSPLPFEQRALKQHAKQFDGIAVFSDDIRDALKGSWFNPELPGFVAATNDLEETVKFGVVGAGYHPQIDYNKLIYVKESYVNSPKQVINYVSCHDDMCLADVLRHSNAQEASDEELKQFNKLAQAVVFTSQGVPFIYAGEELYRDKQGINNTYVSPDSINQINWNNKSLHQDIFTYYQNLIKLRKAHAAFRMTSEKMVQEHLRFLETDSANIVAYTLSNHANGDVWKDILVIYNGNREDVQIQIPVKNWYLALRNDDFYFENNPKMLVEDGVVEVPASSAMILYAN